MLEWKFGSNDLGTYVECPNCHKKLSAEEIIFADIKYAFCPKCNRELFMDDETLDELYESIGLERVS